MHRYWNIAKKKRIRLRSDRTIVESFLRLCSELTSSAICWDEQLGVISYNQMRKAVVALAIKLSKLHDTHIGIMMPSSAGAYIAYFAVLLSGKIPVMVNWSQGYREICACIDLVRVRHVLTSKQLIQYLKQTHGDVEYPFQCLYLEEVKTSLNWWDKCRIGLCLSLPYKMLLHFFGIQDKRPEDTAVILFTSGTEKLPKAVPLTNLNLMANQKACLDFFNPTDTDVMLSFLPPFHAFGFNCCALFPILAGFPVVFAYNPRYPKKAVELIDQTQATFIGSTPIFFDYLMSTAKKQEASLRSLRCVVIGGEAFKDSLRKEAEESFPFISFRQGYGTTECSPVIAINTPNSPAIESCVGLPIAGMEVLIIHTETHVPMATGEIGMVVVRGSSLFSGYLGKDPNDGFLILGGERWYVTGDLGYLDERGELFLRGRLSRFVKIGGEMVSLEAMESLLREAFFKNGKHSEHGLVICGVPGAKMRLCLFTTFPTTVSEVNDILKNFKTSNIMRVSYHHQLECIPMLGTGKPAFGALNAQALSLFGGES